MTRIAESGELLIEAMNILTKVDIGTVASRHKRRCENVALGDRKH